MDYKAKYEQWCQDPIFDKETKAELSAIAGDEKEIEDRFYKDLSFGTGGLRGVMFFSNSSLARSGKARARRL